MSKEIDQTSPDVEPTENASNFRRNPKVNYAVERDERLVDHEEPPKSRPGIG